MAKKVITTKKHYRKYAELSVWINPEEFERICTPEGDMGIPVKQERIRKFFQKDPYLNNIPMVLFESRWFKVAIIMKAKFPEKQWMFDSAECIKIMKHILKYRIGDLEADFMGECRRLACDKPFVKEEVIKEYGERTQVGGGGYCSQECYDISIASSPDTIPTKL